MRRSAAPDMSALRLRRRMTEGSTCGGVGEPRPAQGGDVSTRKLIVLTVGFVLALAGVALAATINGTNGPDTLIGTPKNDTIKGKGGNDDILGLAGDDNEDGGTGADDMYGDGSCPKGATNSDYCDRGKGSGKDK